MYFLNKNYEIIVKIDFSNIFGHLCIFSSIRKTNISVFFIMFINLFILFHKISILLTFFSLFLNYLIKKYENQI